MNKSRIILFAVFSLLFINFAISIKNNTLESQFTEWMIKYNKSYSSNEETIRRFIIWKSNVEYITKQNQLNKDLVLDINKFADLSWNEFKKEKLGYLNININNNLNVNKKNLTPGNKINELPKYINWTEIGVVTPVKDQFMCGSCWAFSTTGAVESMQAIKTGKLISLSEENLIDCSFNFGNEGCGGGLPSLAMKYIMINKGIDTEKSYPLTSFFMTDCLIPEMCPCQFNRSNVGAMISSFKNIIPGNETDLQYGIAFSGPVSVAISATQLFQFYKSGVFADNECSTIDLNHAVLAVGYGTIDNIDYYIVKNSWGTDWGMQGYILMARNHNNMCGIATDALYPFYLI